MRIFGLLLAGTMLAGCAQNNQAIFVTSTGIGIGADSAPGEVTIAYSRHEGFIGPSDSKGNIPSVVGSLEGNLSISEPKVRQLYATGDVAADITTPDDSVFENIEESNKLVDRKRRAYFGVTSTLGLRLAVNPASTGTLGVESFTLGYKRKELSILPLERNKEEKGATAKYPSTLAAIDIDSNTGFNIVSPDPGKTRVRQFFATGVAARNLARSNEEIRKLFKVESELAAKKAADPTTRVLAASDEEKKVYKAWFDANGGDCDLTETVVLESNRCKSTRDAFFEEFNF